MRDYLEIASAPIEEELISVTDKYPYHNAMRHECKVFLQQLQRQFPDIPEGAYLKIKSCSHDFGTYYEVVCSFDDELPASVDYAYTLESTTPLHWDEESKRQLKANKDWCDYWSWKNET